MDKQNKQIEKLEKRVEKVQEKVDQEKEKTKELKQEISNLQKIQDKAKLSAKEFHKELNKALNTAIIAAFGFLIALVWKDLITEYVDRISSISPVQGKLISALIVTLICVVGILIMTKAFPIKE